MFTLRRPHYPPERVNFSHQNRELWRNVQNLIPSPLYFGHKYKSCPICSLVRERKEKKKEIHSPTSPPHRRPHAAGRSRAERSGLINNYLNIFYYLLSKLLSLFKLLKFVLFIFLLVFLMLQVGLEHSSGVA